MAVETAYIAEYTTIDHSRRVRWYEHLPLVGMAFESWVNLTADDWGQMEVTTVVPYDPNVAYNIDMTPDVRFTDRRYHQTYTSHYPVIYQS